MFRKPKNKTSDSGGGSRNIRKRNDEEELQQQIGNNNNGSVIKESGGNVSIRDESAIDQQIQQQKQMTKSKTAGLSFNEEEGDDVVNFKLNKGGTSHHKRSSVALKVKEEKSLRKKQQQKPFGEKLVETEKTAKMMKDEIDDDIIFDEENANRTDESVANQMEAEIRSAFPSSFSGIPDAKAVYEARKKREIMRQVGASGGGGEYIPLDDTVRLKSNGQSGERARLIREDENDLSDEDGETGSFYSAKKLLQSDEDRRREEQAHFLEIEQGDSDDEMQEEKTKKMHQKNSDEEEEEDELQRWEREQIRKGVSSNKVMQLQDEMNATSMNFRGHPYMSELNFEERMVGEAEMDIDMDIELLEGNHHDIKVVNKNQQPKPVERMMEMPLFKRPKISLEDILGGLEQRIADKREIGATREAEFTRSKDQIKENTEMIHKLEVALPELERRFRMFQDVRLYIWNLLDCLNEKILQINELDERVMEMWKQRTEFLVKRRRQDVQDQYERCAAAASGRSFIAPNPEFAQRETEREARRNRRRLQRTTKAMGIHQTSPNSNNQQQHFEGLSSDDEETQSREVHYRDTLASVNISAQDMFLDVEDEFCHIDQIIGHLLRWLAIDSHSFEQAYVPLCLPKLLGPFVRLQMFEWRPLQNLPSQSSTSLQSMPWYRQLLLAGLDNSGLDTQEHPVLVQLIPAMVEKIVFPKIARIVRDQWDPMSLSQSTNLSSLLHSLIHEYSVANAQSKQMREILEQIHAKIRDSLEHETFIPLYSKESIENVETGCGAFLDRQFWRAIKLMRSIQCFRGILSDACLEELLIEGLVNRCIVMALQFSVLTSTTMPEKCRALIEQIPPNWLPPKRPSSYRPLAMILKQVAEIHRSKDRRFAEETEKFVALINVAYEYEKEQQQNNEASE